jgi:murein DD-endopeptidase MepM/ murein hydrolase activator NlpD
MNFDQLGKQHVSRRRRPSPVRKVRSSRRSPSSLDDSSFSQRVSPRPGRNRIFSHLGNIFRSSDGANVSRGNHDTETVENNRGSGFTIPLSWIKKLVIAAGILVIGFIGTNWDIISDKLVSKGVTPESLVDVKVADAGLPIGQGMFLSPEENEVAYYNDIPLILTETFHWTPYIVKEGDNVSTIAANFSLKQDSIIALNKLDKAWDIKIGERLKIPNMDGVPHIVQKNDSISKIAIKMKVPENAILDANEILNDRILVGQELFIPGARMSAGALSNAINPKSSEPPMVRPLAGRLTSGFGWREDPVKPQAGVMRFHSAVDISGKIGDPVKAAMKGTVLHLANNPNLGNFIIMEHGEYQTLYAHLSAFLVKAGDKVEQGHIIGKVGNTGYTTGPHLHFEVFRNGNRINPLDLFK